MYMHCLSEWFFKLASKNISIDMWYSALKEKEFFFCLRTENTKKERRKKLPVDVIGFCSHHLHHSLTRHAKHERKNKSSRRVTFFKVEICYSQDF